MAYVIRAEDSELVLDKHFCIYVEFELESMDKYVFSSCIEAHNYALNNAPREVEFYIDTV